MEKMKLVHNTLTTFKLIIPVSVEKKIRFLCNEIHNIEWSGILFYKTTGNFEDRNLVITCIDIYQMDEGTGGYTEFRNNADTVSYMCNHPELLQDGVYQSIIHSHHSMKAFFSNTDTDTLLEWGSEMPHFVSLIVNNAGNYVAAVTRSVKSRKLIEETIEYPTFGNNKCTGLRHEVQETGYIEYFDLDVIKEGNNDETESEMRTRMTEIRENKSRMANTGKYVPVGEYDRNFREDFSRYVPKKYRPETLFDNTPAKDVDIKVDSSLVDSIVWQSLTCNPFVSADKVNREKWLNSMIPLYNKRFGDISNFEDFAYNFGSFVIDMDSTIDDYMAKYSEFYDRDKLISKIAVKVVEALGKLPDNEWIEVWKNVYKDYIIE